ncbi:hypothetical protein HanHA300_Chr17g0666231 [Helianthus annuus]|nr:hypothetical protein HanHA300_Chr17g0666231 [Helianthus annuus]KAJ0448621.1 hypothetical protein HanHA89_Chr17g0719091 [Helianthus annuus]KAJ0798574.1 hypothetical protein HanLR1_Chr00c2904g0860851 [Helianthus annuus]
MSMRGYIIFVTWLFVRVSDEKISNGQVIYFCILNSLDGFGWSCRVNQPKKRKKTV